jgi:hypothetical protein
MFSPANIHMGMTARDRDGERLGTIIAVDAGGFFVGKGPLFARDLRVAFPDVMELDRDDVYLREDAAHIPGVDAGALARGVRTDKAATDEALQHDLTGGLGVAPMELEAARMDGAGRQDPGQFAGGLGLQPRDLEQARMDSAKFQDPGRYDVGTGSAGAVRERRQEDVISDVDPAVVAVRQPPVVVERRASVDEDAAPRRDALSDLDPNTRR